MQDVWGGRRRRTGKEGKSKSEKKKKKKPKKGEEKKQGPIKNTELNEDEFQEYRITRQAFICSGISMSERPWREHATSYNSKVRLNPFLSPFVSASLTFLQGVIRRKTLKEEKQEQGHIKKMKKKKKKKKKKDEGEEEERRRRREGGGG